MEAEDILALQASLLNLALKVYPEKTEYVDEVLEHSYRHLSKMKEDQYAHPLFLLSGCALTNSFFPPWRVDYTKPPCVKHILSLLNTPLTTYNNVITLTKLKHYSDIIGFLAYQHRRKIAVEVASNAVNNETYIPEPDDVTRIFAAIKPLLMDEDDQGEEPEAVRSPRSLLW